MLLIFKDFKPVDKMSIKSNTPFQLTNASELPIGIFYDDRYSEPWNFNSQQLTYYLNQTLQNYNLTVQVFNATALRNFMEAIQLGIVIISMGVAPQTIWNGSENSFVESWLDNGGIIIWTGCEEFYWIGNDNGENIPIGHVGSSYVLDMNYIKTLSNQIVTPTPLGEDLFLNFSSHTTDVFSSISALIAANVHFEVYAKNGDYADPILFQPRDGSGYFIRIHADWNDQISLLNLSSWIASFVYNRFFNLPVVTELNLVSSLYLLTTQEIFINVTNFSEKFGCVEINSTGDVFQPLNESVTLIPGENRRINLSIIPLTSARFQQYDMTLYLFSNYTNFKNESKSVLIYSKKITFHIYSPLTVEILDVSETMYPGSTYTLTLKIQKHINESIPLEIFLICDGCINQLRTNLNLVKNETTYQITFSIIIMAKAGSYKIYLRVYQGGILYSSLNVSVQIQSLFQNPLYLLLLCLLSGIIIALTSLHLYKRKRGRSRDEKILTSLDSKNKVFLNKGNLNAKRKVRK